MIYSVVWLAYHLHTYLLFTTSANWLANSGLFVPVFCLLLPVPLPNQSLCDHLSKAATLLPPFIQRNPSETVANPKQIATQVYSLNIICYQSADSSSCKPSFRQNENNLIFKTHWREKSGILSIYCLWITHFRSSVLMWDFEEKYV